jgi:hypothetical protein
MKKTFTKILASLFIAIFGMVVVSGATTGKYERREKRMYKILISIIIGLTLMVGCGSLNDKNLTPEERAEIQKANADYWRQQNK